MTPWETVCIDIIGPYTVTDRSGNDRILNAMAFVDPATGWFEITVKKKDVFIASRPSKINQLT